MKKLLFLLPFLAAIHLHAATYSGAVGYVIRELQEGFNLMNNPLDYGENQIKEIYPNLPDGSAVYTFDPVTGYTISTLDEGTWIPDGNIKLPPGRGHWVRVTRRVFHTYIGTVRQGDISTPLFAGLNLVGSQVPQEGLIAGDLWYAPTNGDLCYQYRPDRGYTIFEYDEPAWTPNGQQPYLAVGEGVWIRRLTSGVWQRSFHIEP